MKIKKVNELFDTDELKAKHEINYLTGKLKPEELISNVNLKKETDFVHTTLNKLINKFLFFKAFKNNNYKNIEKDGFVLSFGKRVVPENLKNQFNIGENCIFIFKNKNWDLEFVIENVGSLYNVKIKYNKHGNNFVMNFSNTQLGDNKPIVKVNENGYNVEVYNNLSFDDIYKVIEKYLIRRLIDLGFGYIIHDKYDTSIGNTSLN